MTEMLTTYHSCVHGLPNYVLELIFKVILDTFVIKFLDCYLINMIYFLVVMSRSSLCCFFG